MKSVKYILLILISIQVFAFRYAYTISNKTIVYSDKNLDIPIGFIRSGRKLKVGDKSLKSDSIVPLVVSGRVAYIKAEDITFKLEDEKLMGGPEIKEHDINDMFLTTEDKLSRNNFFSISGARVGSGEDWKNLNDALELDSSSILLLSLKVEHRDPSKRSAFAFGLNSISTSTEKAKLGTLTLSGEYQYKVLNNAYFTTEAFAALHFSGDVKIEVIDNKPAKGVIYGYALGLRARFFPYKRFNFFAEITTLNLNASSIEPLIIDNKEHNVSSIGGTGVAIGLSFRI